MVHFYGSKGKKAGFNTFYSFNEVNTDLGPVTDPAWPVSTGGAAVQAHCVLVERSKQWNTSFNQLDLSKDKKKTEDQTPSIQQHSLNKYMLFNDLDVAMI